MYLSKRRRRRERWRRVRAQDLPEITITFFVEPDALQRLQQPVKAAAAAIKAFEPIVHRLLLELGTPFAQFAEIANSVQINFASEEESSDAIPRPIACKGCRWWHGQTYNGNQLICAKHPLGVAADFCSDHSQITSQLP